MWRRVAVDSAWPRAGLRERSQDAGGREAQSPAAEPAVEVRIARQRQLDAPPAGQIDKLSAQAPAAGDPRIELQRTLRRTAVTCELCDRVACRRARRDGERREVPQAELL